MEDYSKLFDAGNAAQLEQMMKNSHKSGWDDFSIYASFTGINHNLCRARNKTHIEMREIAANIANYAHMIILQCNKNIGKNDEKIHLG